MLSGVPSLLSTSFLARSDSTPPESRSSVVVALPSNCVEISRATMPRTSHIPKVSSGLPALA